MSAGANDPIIFMQQHTHGSGVLSVTRETGVQAVYDLIHVVLLHIVESKLQDLAGKNKNRKEV